MNDSQSSLFANGFSSFSPFQSPLESLSTQFLTMTSTSAPERLEESSNSEAYMSPLCFQTKKTSQPSSTPRQVPITILSKDCPYHSNNEDGPRRKNALNQAIFECNGSRLPFIVDQLPKSEEKNWPSPECKDGKFLKQCQQMQKIRSRVKADSPTNLLKNMVSFENEAEQRCEHIENSSILTPPTRTDGLREDISSRLPRRARRSFSLTPKYSVSRKRELHSISVDSKEISKMNFFKRNIEKRANNYTRLDSLPMCSGSTKQAESDDFDGYEYKIQRPKVKRQLGDKEVENFFSSKAFLRPNSMNSFMSFSSSGFSADSEVQPFSQQHRRAESDRDLHPFENKKFTVSREISGQCVFFSDICWDGKDSSIAIDTVDSDLSEDEDDVGFFLSLPCLKSRDDDVAPSQRKTKRRVIYNAPRVFDG